MKKLTTPCLKLARMSLFRPTLATFPSSSHHKTCRAMTVTIKRMPMYHPRRAVAPLVVWERSEASRMRDLITMKKLVII